MTECLKAVVEIHFKREVNMTRDHRQPNLFKVLFQFALLIWKGSASCYRQKRENKILHKESCLSCKRIFSRDNFLVNLDTIVGMQILPR